MNIKNKLFPLGMIVMMLNIFTVACAITNQEHSEIAAALTQGPTSSQKLFKIGFEFQEYNHLCSWAPQHPEV